MLIYRSGVFVFTNDLDVILKVKLWAGFRGTWLVNKLQPKVFDGLAPNLVEMFVILLQ